MSEGFSAEEKAAMKEAAAEKRRAAKRAKSADKAAADLQDLMDKIEAMGESDRALALTVHELIMSAAPQLAPRTWYGMPAYSADGKVVCFFQESGKFKSRYSTLGFQDPARLDDGTMWPTSFAITAIGPREEQAIRDLVKQAVGE